MGNSGRGTRSLVSDVRTERSVGGHSLCLPR